jgi:hypothetical protein
MTTPSAHPMLDLLAASGPDPEHADALMLYGRLVGSWAISNRFRDAATGQWRTVAGEWRFGWVLGGRAVQDVLSFPGVGERYPGTTVRCYDIPTGLWHVHYLSPFSGAYVTQIGRPYQAGGILQEGGTPEQGRTRWIFTDVSADGFRWQGFNADPGSDEFELRQEMHATRE